MNIVSEEKKRRNVAIGLAVKAFLQENKISVNQLAEESGVLANNISRSLSGRNRIPEKVVDVLIDKYGFEESFFLPRLGAAQGRVLLSFPKEDFNCLKFLAAKESKPLYQMLIDTIYEKYADKIEKLKSL